MITIIKFFKGIIFGNRQKRYNSIHAVLSIIAIRLGYRMGNKNLVWHKDKDFSNVYSIISKNDTGKKRIPERKYVLYSIAKSIRNIKGDIAECGVSRGHSSFLMLHANKDNNKIFHGFDSFEGLSLPDEEDFIKNNYSFKWNKNDLSSPQEIADSNLVLFEGRYKLYKGWIPDRFNEVKNRKFSLVHVDVDLFRPTLESLIFFWDKLNIGGVLICDDYGFETCPGAYKAMNDFFKSKQLEIIHLTTGQGLVFKQ